jgi:hypothetical protein
LIIDILFPDNPYRASFPTTSIPSQIAEHDPSFDTSDMNESYSDRSSDEDDKPLPVKPKNTKPHSPAARSSAPVQQLPAPPVPVAKSKPFVSDHLDKHSGLVDEYGFLWETLQDVPPPT